MKNNFIYNSEFSNIYERPNINSNVSTQILFGENFSILKKSKNIYFEDSHFPFMEISEKDLKL